MMKKLFTLIILIGLLFVGFRQGPAIAAEVKNVIYSSPCDTPKTYSIGVVDPRFNISREELLAVSKQASTLWKNKQGENILVYDPDAALTLNLIYDERQFLNTQITDLNTEVQQQGDTLKPEIQTYEQKVASFKQKMAELNARIDYWNNQGGAPQEEYDKLTTEQRSLQQEAIALESMARQLNQSTDQYNNQVNQLDQKVNSYNETLSYKPEQGEYIRKGRDEKILIYFNSSSNELLHTVAHEMGHAIGVDHNNNPQSIMYPQTTLATMLSADDTTALAAACQKRSIIEVAQEKVALLLTEIRTAIAQR